MTSILCDVLAYLAVTAGDSLLQLSPVICEYKGKAVQLPAQEAFVLTQPSFQLLNALGLVKRQHFRGMTYLLKSRGYLVAHLLSAAAAEDNPRLFFQSFKLVVELIVLLVGHYLHACVIVGVGSLCQQLVELFHSVYIIISHSENSLVIVILL